MALGDQVYVAIEQRPGGVMHVVYVEGIELEGVIWTRVYDNPNDKTMPSGCIKLTIECYAKLEE